MKLKSALGFCRFCKGFSLFFLGMYLFEEKPEYNVYYGVTPPPPAPTGFAAPEVEPFNAVRNDVMMGSIEEDMEM